MSLSTALFAMPCHTIQHTTTWKHSRTYTVHTQSTMRTIRFSQRHSFESSVHKVLPWVEVEILVLRDVNGNNKRSKVSNSLSRRDWCIYVYIYLVIYMQNGNEIMNFHQHSNKIKSDFRCVCLRFSIGTSFTVVLIFIACICYVYTYTMWCAFAFASALNIRTKL